jgi:hypothetical protein
LNTRTTPSTLQPKTCQIKSEPRLFNTYTITSNKTHKRRNPKEPSRLQKSTIEIEIGTKIKTHQETKINHKNRNPVDCWSTKNVSNQNQLIV